MSNKKIYSYLFVLHCTCDRCFKVLSAIKDKTLRYLADMQGFWKRQLLRATFMRSLEGSYEEEPLHRLMRRKEQHGGSDAKEVLLLYSYLTLVLPVYHIASNLDTPSCLEELYKLQREIGFTIEIRKGTP